MADEVDVKSTLLKRDTMLTGKAIHLFKMVIATKKPTSVAIELVKTMSPNGAKCYLISGGFDLMAKTIAILCGFDNYHASSKGVADEKLPSIVKMPILDQITKGSCPKHYCKIREINTSDAATMVDGASYSR